jgi:hypothetical protein
VYSSALARRVVDVRAEVLPVGYQNLLVLEQARGW